MAESATESLRLHRWTRHQYEQMVEAGGLTPKDRGQKRHMYAQHEFREYWTESASSYTITSSTTILKPKRRLIGRIKSLHSLSPAR